MRRRRRRGSDGWELVADFARVIKALGVLGGRERRQALFQTSPLIYLKLESCRANDGATTILRLPPRSIRCRPILRSNSFACYPYLSNSGAHIRRDDFERKLDVGKNSVFLPRYLVQSQLNEARKSWLRVKSAGKSIIPLRLRGDSYRGNRFMIIELFVLKSDYNLDWNLRNLFYCYFDIAMI